MEAEKEGKKTEIVQVKKENGKFGEGWKRKREMGGRKRPISWKHTDLQDYVNTKMQFIYELVDTGKWNYLKIVRRAMEKEWETRIFIYKIIINKSAWNK